MIKYLIVYCPIDKSPESFIKLGTVLPRTSFCSRRVGMISLMGFINLCDENETKRDTFCYKIEPYEGFDFWKIVKEVNENDILKEYAIDSLQKVYNKEVLYG
nr:MAG TPA: hypothetical protein [Caudoviricetes sp.]